MTAPRMQLTHDEVVDLAPLYVLGSLEADEAEAVRLHLADCREPHPELEELGGVVPAARGRRPRGAAPALKERIMAAAASIGRGRR